MTVLLGIDAGGTFTDFIVYKNGGFATYKILSTPEDPQRAIVTGLNQLGLDDECLHIVHGTTVATNALLEGKGARTAFVTNQGFKDLLHIGRQTRNELYSLCPQRTRELITKDLCFEIAGRVAADGSLLEQTTDQDISRLQRTLASHKVDAVAICMLFSFLDASAEEALEEVLRDRYFVSCSSKLLPEQREYERAVVTWLNSYLGPLTHSYLQTLQIKLTKQTVHVMQSDATTAPASVASLEAVRLLLSGPAGGVTAAAEIGKQVGVRRLLTLDMGGTSTDVALIDGEPKCISEGHLGEFPLVIPMLDIHTIGAGGGSIARVDAAGGLHVGPESAGAQPGPACYGQGGQEATITDANVVLGRLPASVEWSCGLRLDPAAALTAVTQLAEQMDCSATDAALGIIALANAHMAQALRVISIHRGFNPAEFCLFPFGGAGGLHMCEVADKLAIRNLLVPAHAGILSAQGMLYAPVGQVASQSVCQLWTQLRDQQIDQLCSHLYQRAVKQLQLAGLEASRSTCLLDLRYQGQSTSISIEWQDPDEILQQFQQAHHKRFGFKLDAKNIELVTARVWVYQDVQPPIMPELEPGSAAGPIGESEVDGVGSQAPIYQRAQFVADQEIIGPCIVLDQSGTIYVKEHWFGRVDPHGHIHLHNETND